MNMDHRTNQYFDQLIVCPITDSDLGYRSRSKLPTTLKISVDDQKSVLKKFSLVVSDIKRN